MIKSSTLVGVLRTEMTRSEGLEQSVAGPRDVTMLRPARVGVRNDGYRGYWMAPGWVYQLRHDGIGWRVERKNWTEDHILRLVDAQDGRRWVDELPVEGGTVALERGRTYELRERTPYGVWEVHQM